MANAKKCDRCGKLYEPYDIFRITPSKPRLRKAIRKYVFSPSYMGDSILTIDWSGVDLCKDCQKELIDWFHIKEK